MKLYFPTSSLNFNDIFATESISPSYVYRERSFGTKNHSDTELAQSQTYTTLFTKIPYFRLIDENTTEYEQYPIVVELIVDNTKDKFIKINDETYITSQTIYFERENMKVYFFSDEHMKIVLVKSRLVNETKLVKKYEENFSVISKEASIKIQDIIYPVLNRQDRELTLKFDKTLNSFKGFYYSYIIQKYKNRYIDIYSRYNINLKKLDYIRKSLEVKDYNEDDVVILIENTLVAIEKSQKKLVADLENEHDMIIQEMEIARINDHKVELNRKLINNITNEEIVFEIILNNVIKNPKSRTGNIDDGEIFMLIENVGKAMANAPAIYKSDIALIYRRIVKRELEINVENIKSVVMKNFFTFLLKYNNIEELKNFISLKKIDNDYFCYSYYGAFYGFSGLSRILTHDLFLSENINLFDIIDYNIQKVSKQIWKNIFTYNDRKQEIISDSSSRNNIINESNTTLDNNELSETDKLIYYEIKKIKESKSIKYYLNTKSIIRDSNNCKIIFDFERNSNEDIVISINYTEVNKIFKILLFYKNNCENNKKQDFKKIVAKLNIDAKICNGNYPVFKYNVEHESNKSNMNKVDKAQLLMCLQLLAND